MHKNNNNIYNELICINDEKLLNIEDKIFPFSTDKQYNYASIIINSENILPKININLSKLQLFFKDFIKNDKNTLILEGEIAIINSFFTSLTSNIDLNKAGPLFEQSRIYYLYHLMSNFLFYILLNPNFNTTKIISQNYYQFFSNYQLIKNSATLYLNKINEIENTNLLINNELIDEYYEIINYKKPFEDIVAKFNILISNIYQSIFSSGVDEEEKIIIFLEKILFVFNICHSINEKYNIIDYKCFYNEYISKNINFDFEFRIFLNNDKIIKEKNKNKKFTFFNYIWLFVPSAKYQIINLFNATKQIQQIKGNIDILSELDKYSNIRELLKANNYVVRFNINRDNIIEETLRIITKVQDKLKYPLSIKFLGEEAEDEGGVKKEFFMLIIREIFNANFGMFTYNEKTRLFWFNCNCFESTIQYELIGTIIGLALFNGVILDIKFPKALYKKLLGIKPCLNDLKEYDPELYNNLNYLLNTDDKNLKDNLDSNFTALIDKFGEKVFVPLKPNGENIMIDYENKNEYVELYVNWFFNESIREYYNAFEKGFYIVFDKELSKILSPEELELIICGTRNLDFLELQKGVKYEGYNKESITIKYLWEILMKFNEEEKKKFLIFVTGCDKAPIDGLAMLPFVIGRNYNVNDLPSSHTCFNHLILPDYQNKELMEKKIRIAISYSEGFGLK